jgi:hypothetical protein
LSYGFRFFRGFFERRSLRLKKLGTLAPGHPTLRRVMTGVRIVAGLKLLPPP